MKLSKTEQKLLEEASKSYRGRLSVTVAAGIGPEGGHIDGGARDRNAAFKLVEKGLFTFLTADSDRETRRGRTAVYATSLFEITDAGRRQIDIYPIVADYLAALQKMHGPADKKRAQHLYEVMTAKARKQADREQARLGLKSAYGMSDVL